MRYAELTEYIEKRGGIRTRINTRLRDQVISWIVSDWPVGGREDELAVVLMERLHHRMRGSYSSVVLTFLLYIVVSQLVQLAIEWFLERLANRELMMTYHAQASGNL